MRFNVRQHFPHALEVMVARYTDPRTWERPHDFTKVQVVEVIDAEQDSESVLIKVRYRFIAPLPGAVTAVVDPRKLTWVEEARTDLEAATTEVRLLPDHYGDKLNARATATFHRVEGGCRREVDGDLRVRMLLVGGQVEKAIASGLGEHLKEEEQALA